MKYLILILATFLCGFTAQADTEKSQLVLIVQQNGVYPTQCRVSEYEINRILAHQDQTACNDFNGELTAEFLSTMLENKSLKVNFCYDGSSSDQLDKVFKAWSSTSFFNPGNRFLVSKSATNNQLARINFYDKATKKIQILTVRLNCQD